MAAVAKEQAETVDDRRRSSCVPPRGFCSAVHPTLARPFVCRSTCRCDAGTRIHLKRAMCEKTTPEFPRYPPWHRSDKHQIWVEQARRPRATVGPTCALSRRPALTTPRLPAAARLRKSTSSRPHQTARQLREALARREWRFAGHQRFRRCPPTQKISSPSMMTRLACIRPRGWRWPRNLGPGSRTTAPVIRRVVCVEGQVQLNPPTFRAKCCCVGSTIRAHERRMLRIESTPSICNSQAAIATVNPQCLRFRHFALTNTGTKRYDGSTRVPLGERLPRGQHSRRCRGRRRYRQSKRLPKAGPRFAGRAPKLSSSKSTAPVACSTTSASYTRTGGYGVKGG